MATGNQAVARAAGAIVALLRDMGEEQAVVSITFKGDQPQIVITGIGGAQ